MSLRVPRRALPQFCSSAELLALLVVALLVAVVMQLAPGADAHLRVWSLALLFAAWLATLLGVALCKSRRLLQLLPGAWPWAGAWLLAVLTIAFEMPASELLYPAGHPPLAVALLQYAGGFQLHQQALLQVLGMAVLLAFALLAHWAYQRLTPAAWRQLGVSNRT